MMKTKIDLIDYMMGKKPQPQRIVGQMMINNGEVKTDFRLGGYMGEDCIIQIYSPADREYFSQLKTSGELDMIVERERERLIRENG